MTVNRAGSTIFGAHFSKAEKKALDIEARKAVVKESQRHYSDMDASLLYYAHDKYGWGKKKLRDFWEGFSKIRKELTEWYLLENNDDVNWVCKQKLKDIGVDVEEWLAEDEKK